MKKLLIAFSLILIVGVAKAQTKDTTAKQPEVFMPVEMSADYPGGMERFYMYLMRTTKYPDKAKENKIEGKVAISFIVEKDGSLTDIQVVKSLSPETDAEAIRVIKASVKWKPAMQNGTPVRQKYQIPVPFSMPN